MTCRRRPAGPHSGAPEAQPRALRARDPLAADAIGALAAQHAGKSWRIWWVSYGKRRVPARGVTATDAGAASAAEGSD
jgi:hypothetical protein